MASNCLLVLSLILVVFSSSCVLRGSSDPDLNGFLQSLSQGSGSLLDLRDTMQCMQKLASCKPYVKDPVAEPPSAVCCLQLKVMVEGDTECLCKFFNDPKVLARLNITQDDALELPKACGVDIDVSRCNQEASAPADAAAAKSTSTATSSNTSSNTSGSTKRITHFGVVAAFAAIFMIAFPFSA